MGLLDDYEAERQKGLPALPQRLIGKGVAAFWQSLPPEVRAQWASGARSIPQIVGELSPGAAVRDVVDESGNMVKAAESGDWIGAGSGPARMAVAALGVMPFLRSGRMTSKAAQETIRAYHGSPHDFDKFDLAKIGTGEGTQAFGHGVYLAENPKVAETYRPEGGHMYEVKVNADPKRIIDDDLPLVRSGVPPEVIEKWREAKTAEERMTILRDAGFQGRKYLDQGSREGGKGTSNYVIFDPSIIEILRKYGMAPLAAGGAAATVPGLLADDQGGY